MLTVSLLGLTFVGSHFLMSLAEVRGPLVQRLGESGFLGVYSLVSAVLLVLMVLAYGEADRSIYWWYPEPMHASIAIGVMWFATVFIAGSFMAPNPSSVGMGDKAKEGPQGMLRVTRHPLLWGIGLWAFAHVLANGDVSSVMFFLSFGVLAVVGALVLDRKKASQLGSDWTSFMTQTSLVPFAAILGGRTQFAARELVGPLLVGSLVYAGLYWAHEWLSGVDLPIPWGA